MKITIDCTPEEARNLPQLLGVNKSIEELAQEQVTIERNKETLRRFQEEVFKAADWSTENLLRFLTPDIIDHTSLPGDTPGLEGVQTRFSQWALSFAEATEEVEMYAAQGDLIAIYYHLKAKHTGDFFGIEATNQPVSIPGIQFLRFEDGKIAEHWGIYDYRATADEIGARLSFTPLAPKTPRGPIEGETPTGDKATGYTN